MSRVGGRIRTESMIDRLGKKPLSEGFDLWDKDYVLGALRLLQCKLDAQTAGTPPFEVAQALDAVAEIMSSLDESEEAHDHYTQAVDKYNLIQRKLLADLMGIKAVGQKEGPEAALSCLDKLLAVFDERAEKGSDIAGDEAKNQEPALGRCYLYRAQLLSDAGKKDEALKHVGTAISLNCDRVHLCHYLKGELLQAAGQSSDAVAALQDSIKARAAFVPAYETLASILKESDVAGAVEVIDQAMALHPQANLIREKAFLLSEKGDDTGALDMLEKAIAQPPHEETETLSNDCESVGTLLKAKAAILADMKRFPDALAALDEVLKVDADDGEAVSMRKDIAELQ